MAGLFFSFSTFILKALEEIETEQGVAAMISINKSILNPLFGVVFFGTALLSIYFFAVSFTYSAWTDKVLLGGGSGIYLIGVLGVTMRWNVPLNNDLERIIREGGNPKAVWMNYALKWKRWNHVRTIMALIALTFFLICINKF